MTNAVAISLSQDRRLQVSGLKTFEENRWREAILYYLFGMWGDKDNVTYRPKIRFGSMSLSLNTITNRYYAYGRSLNWEVPPFKGDEILIIGGCDQNEVDIGLARFVKNDRIRIIVIPFGNDQFLRLWKTDRRGEYGCHGHVPTLFEDITWPE